MTDDAALLRRYVEHHSEEAFAELVRRHVGLVYHAAWRRTGQAHLAEEICQDVFVEVARNATSLSQHPSLIGWLYTTTRFVTAKRLRAESRRRAREQEAELMHDSHPQTEPSAEQLRPVLDPLLDELSDRD